MMMTAPVCAQETTAVVLDSVKTDTVVKSAPRKLGLIRRIIRGFDKVDERYIGYAQLRLLYTPLGGRQQAVDFLLA